jgi:hypothetical protein
LRKAIAALFFVSLFSAAVEAAPVRWQGQFQITARSVGCDESIQVGVSGRIRFRPGIGGENGADSSLSMFSSRQTTNFTLVGGLLDDTFRVVDAVYIGDSFLQFENEVRVRFTRQKPAVLDASVDFVDITSQIRGFNRQPLCSVTVRMSLFRRDF